MSLTICVTQEHIEDAANSSHDMSRSKTCAIARALRDLTGDETCWVSPIRAGVHNRTYKLSPPARQFISAADNGKLVEPSVFTLEYEEDIFSAPAV